MDDFHRRSIRLPGHDYSGEAVYFITLCVQDKANLFGRIENGLVQLSPYGEIVKAEWLRTPQIRKLGEYGIMPNHFHATLAFHPVGAHGGAPSRLGGAIDPGIIDDSDGKRSELTLVGRGSSGAERAHRRAPLRVPQSLGSMIAGFKQATTVQINRLRNTPHAIVWQRNYWEHIIRDEEDWQRIADYILSNPLRWKEDKLYKG
jgi:hypothetical protein